MIFISASSIYSLHGNGRAGFSWRFPCSSANLKVEPTGAQALGPNFHCPQTKGAKGTLADSSVTTDDSESETPGSEKQSAINASGVPPKTAGTTHMQGCGVPTCVHIISHILSQPCFFYAKNRRCSNSYNRVVGGFA